MKAGVTVQVRHSKALITRVARMASRGHASEGRGGKEGVKEGERRKGLLSMSSPLQMMGLKSRKWVCI